MDLLTHNGTSFQGSGDVASRLLQSGMDPGALKPWVCEKSGRSYITLNQMERGGKVGRRNFVYNSPATLRKDEWIRLDEAVLRVVRPQLRVWGDLNAQNLMYSVPDAMGVSILQYQTMSDFGKAELNMDGLSRTLRDRPQFDLVSLPLPIVHADWNFSLRELMISRQRNTPLDTTSAEAAARRCAEQIEMLTLGTNVNYTYAGVPVYGITNYPYRITQTITLPTSSSWTPQLHVDQVLGMVQASQNLWFNGPWGLYYSRGWSKYLDGDYTAAYNGNTLRTRLKQIDKIQFVEKVDFLPDYTVVLWQLSTDCIRGVMGMQLQTLQWESHGGMEINFKVMGIMVPQMRANYNQTTGIVHAVAA